MTGSFGPSVSEIHVEQWIMDLTELLFPDYLAESERIHADVIENMEPGFWPRLSSIVRTNEWEGMWPDEQLPCLLVINTGLSDRPERRGDGEYCVTWLVAAAIVVSAATRNDTRNAAFGYGHAFKQMVLQHRGLNQPDHVRGVTWIDSRPMPLPPEGERSLMAMQMFFQVEVKGVLTDAGVQPNYPDPAPDPYVPPGPEVEITTAGPATIEPQEIQ